MPELPTGVITLLFTDIEGSTRLWERFPDAMPAAISRHDMIVRQAIEENGGAVFRTVGDAFFAAFAEAMGGLLAALQAQYALYGEPWEAIGLPSARVGARFVPPLRVRMALHTSPVEMRAREYFGHPLNRVARLLSAGHGGQTLLFHDTYELVRDGLPAGVTLRDLSEHRLKDLSQPVRIFQLIAERLPDDFPPLKTLTTAEAQKAGDVAALRQAKLPGMPGVDFDAVWRKEKERERQRKTRKGKTKEREGLF